MRQASASIPQHGHSAFPNACLARLRRRRSRSRSSLVGDRARAAARSISARDGPDKEKPQKPVARRRPTAQSAPRNVNEPRLTPHRARRWPRPARREEALAEFDKALALDPYNAQALYGRGLIYQGEKQHGWRSPISPPPTACPATGRAAARPRHQLSRHSTRSRKPRPISTRPLQADPNNAQVWSTRGQAYERLGDKAKAAAPTTARRAPPTRRCRAQRPRARRRLTRLAGAAVVNRGWRSSAGRRGTSTSCPTASRRRHWSSSAAAGSRRHRRADRAAARSPAPEYRPAASAGSDRRCRSRRCRAA